MRQIRLGQQIPPLPERSKRIEEFRGMKHLTSRKCSVPLVQDLVDIYMLVGNCACQKDGPAASMSLIGDSVRSAGRFLKA